LIHAEREGRMAALDTDVSSIYGEGVARGMLHSTITVQRIGQLCARELSVRARFVETHLTRVASETLTELPADLAATLKAEGQLYIREDALQLRDYAQEKANSAYAGHAIHARELVESEEARAIKRFQANVDFFVARLETRIAQQQSAPGGPNITVHGAVGAIQTGAGAVANVWPSLSRDDLSRLGPVLEDLAARVSSFEMPTAKRDELKQVVSEALLEARAPNPNSTKLGGALVAIATTVQGIASGQGAYQALRDMLVLLGFPMP